TSGTTGRPKGVVYSHRSTVIHSLIANQPDHWGLGAGDCVLPATPMFHANCWGVPYVCVMTGVKMVFPGPHLHAEDLLDLFAAERPTYVLGVPTIWLTMLQLLDGKPERYRLPPGMRMLVRGTTITGAYHDTALEAEKFTADGWLRTGDVASIDRHGYVRVADRIKDLIKSGGEWISSMDMENLLMAHPAVLEAAVIAIQDAKWGERPLACVVLKANQAAAAAELDAHLTGTFAKWQLPDRYEFLDALPRTSTGKFWKTKLRERFGSQNCIKASSARCPVPGAGHPRYAIGSVPAVIIVAHPDSPPTPAPRHPAPAAIVTIG